MTLEVDLVDLKDSSICGQRDAARALNLYCVGSAPSLQCPAEKDKLANRTQKHRPARASSTHRDRASARRARAMMVATFHRDESIWAKHAKMQMQKRLRLRAGGLQPFLQ